MVQLLINEKNGSNYIVYELSGELNSYTSSEISEKIFTNIKVTNIAVDLSQIQSIDSTGIGILMAGFNDAEEFGTRFYLMNPSPAARTAIEDTGFYSVFHFIHSVNEIAC